MAKSNHLKLYQLLKLFIVKNTKLKNAVSYSGASSTVGDPVLFE